MNVQKIGYKRVSTLDQKVDRQLEGIILDKVFEEKASGKDVHRPKLQELIEFAREGDTVVVDSMDRLGRNLGDLRNIVQELNQKGVAVEFLKERMTFNRQVDSMTQLMFSILGAFAEFERALIKERQREGITIAKKKNVYKGRGQALTQEKASELKIRALNGESKTKLAQELGIGRRTVYEYIKK